jgi:hypothetical protein
MEWIKFLTGEADTIANAIAVLTATLAGAWIVYKYLIQRDFFPRVEFNVDVLFKVEREDLWIAELLCEIENAGLVRHKRACVEFYAAWYQG